MVKLSVVNLEKWIYSFVRNLTFQVSPISNKKLDKINFTCHIDPDYRMNFEILKDIARRSTLDVTDAQSVCNFIDKQTKFLDEYVYPESTFLSSYHNNHINKKIVQRYKDMKINKNTREQKAVSRKIKSAKLKRVAVNDHGQTCNAKALARTVMSNQKSLDLSLTKPRNIFSKELDTTKSITAHIRQEAVSNEKYLQLYLNDVEFMKNIHITLYIASKTLYDIQYHSDIHLKQKREKLNYQHILMLCKHAVLCLIDPSEKVFVYIENNLSVIIQNYLSQGCIYHFDSTSNTKNYSVLLVLSKRAKSLVRHPNTIMLRTISAILRCNIHDILVLSHCLDDNYI